MITVFQHFDRIFYFGMLFLDVYSNHSENEFFAYEFWFVCRPAQSLTQWLYGMRSLVKTCYVFFFLNLKFHEFTTFLSFWISLIIVIILPSFTTFVSMAINFYSIEKKKLEHYTNRSLAVPVPTFSVISYNI